LPSLNRTYSPLSWNVSSKDDKTLGKVLTDGTLEYGSARSLIETFPGINLKRGTYVTLGDDEAEYFVGEVIEGPYYAEKSSLGSENFSVYVIELSAFVKNGVAGAVLSRPPPRTSVKLLKQKDVELFLETMGEMRLGVLPTQDVWVGMDPDTLTRHLGIFGTTGGGKSNTIQVLVEEAVRNGFAVIIFDVEGEYIFMDNPTDRLIELLKAFGEEPKGLEDLRVYVPVSSTSRRNDATRFSVSFVDSDKDIFSEVVGLSRLEQLYFMDLIDNVMKTLPTSEHITLGAVIERLRKRLVIQADRGSLPEFIAEAHTNLYSKLVLTSKLGLVDVDFPILKPSEFLKSGRVSVVDFSDTNDSTRNLVITNLLDSIFKHKMKSSETTSVLIVIEEAHTFISANKRDKMLATLLMLIELARRGRKRGLCLGFVTQQPAHLPSEILELCNTRIMHRMSSSDNIGALKSSTGNVPESLWTLLPSLGKGEAVIASPKYSRAVTVKVRPVRSKRAVTGHG
jgi:DNA helicase HerA-like ATPase